MNTDNLNQVLFSNPTTKKYFLGTFPACAPIRSRKKAYGFITNTDCHDRPGQHWCAWWIADGHALFFDSFGRPPTHHSFPRDFYKLTRNFKSCKYVPRAVQLVGTTSCGHFCAHFIHTMSSKKGVARFLSWYKDIERNDKIVRANFKTL